MTDGIHSSGANDRTVGDKAGDCLLTLALPTMLEEDVLELLQSRPEWTGGVSVLHGEASGDDAILHSAIEKVRGRARRTVILISTREDHAGQLIALLRESFRTAEISWWTTPVSARGSLA